MKKRKRVGDRIREDEKSVGNGKASPKQEVQREEPAQPKASIPARGPKIEEKAYRGIARELVRLIEPHSEADPAALLLTVLAMFGNCLGRTAHFEVEDRKHFLNLFIALVGLSSKGRKGTSKDRILAFFRGVDPEWSQGRILQGMSSGEGFMWPIRDPITTREKSNRKRGKVGYEEVQSDPGVADKRAFWCEPEFASVLTVMTRSGNTLSVLIRQAWDGDDLAQQVKNNPAKVTAPHVSIMGHITEQELKKLLSVTDQANGFGNRFLWVQVERSKLLPHGGSLDPATLGSLQEKFRQALKYGRDVGRMDWTEEGRAAWEKAYPCLSRDRHGLSGAMLSRAETQVWRLACVYAILDLCDQVGVDHLQAAIAIWAHVEHTVTAIFGNSLGDPDADAILAELQDKEGGMNKTEIFTCFKGHRTKVAINKALDLLERFGLAYRKPEKTGGRPAERWYAHGQGCELSE